MIRVVQKKAASVVRLIVRDPNVQREMNPFDLFSLVRRLGWTELARQVLGSQVPFNIASDENIQSRLWTLPPQDASLISQLLVKQEKLYHDHLCLNRMRPSYCNKRLKSGQAYQSTAAMQSYVCKALAMKRFGVVCHDFDVRWEDALANTTLCFRCKGLTETDLESQYNRVCENVKTCMLQIVCALCVLSSSSS
jgi:hypothetical protein